MIRLRYILCAVLVFMFSVGCDDVVLPDNEDIGQDPSPDQIPDPEETGEFIILAWSDIIDAYNCEWKLQKMVDADFNMYLGWFGSYEEAEALLTAADNVGIDIITSCPELQSDPRNMTGRLSAHKSLYGYHIMDEPGENHFQYLKTLINEIRKYDPERPCYVNLYPNWAWGGEDAYISLVRKFVNTVPVSFLSFDNYPIKTVDGVSTVRHDWYHNLEDIRTVADESGMPFWAFALALAHSTDEASYPIPTLGELRLQQFSNMLYGAVAFQYFTTWGFIQDHGTTNVYNNIRIVNSELRAYQKYFFGADIKGVWHTGKTVPSGTKKLEALPSGVAKLETEDTGALVSYFTKSGRNYIAVVNKNCNWGMDLFISFDDAGAVMIGKDGQKTRIEEKYRIPAGDIRLFTWK